MTNINSTWVLTIIEKFFGKIEYFGVFVLSILFILLHSLLLLRGFEYLVLLPLVLIIVWMAFFSLDKLMLVLAFFVPLSIQLSYFNPKLPVNLSLPSEAIIIGVMIIFFMKVLIDDSFDKNIAFHPVSVAIYFYLAWMFITSLTSEMPLVSFKFFIAKLWFITVFYFLATQLFQKFKNIPRYVWFYASGLIIVIILAVYHLASIDISDHRLANRVVQPFYNDHTDYAAAIAMIMVFVGGYFFLRRKVTLLLRIIYLGLFIFFFIALVLSYTRAAWLSLIVAFGILIGMLLRFRLRYIFLILGILISLFFYFKTDILIALERNKQDSDKDFSRHIASITNISTDASNLERLNRWACAIRMFKERPIFGWGPGTYQFQYAPFQKKSEMTIISTRRGDVGNAHSEYLGKLAEMGILGSLSFIAIIVATMATASKLYFRAKRRKVRIMAITLLIALLSYYAHGIMNNFLDADKLSALFWAFTAMIVALDVYHAPKLRKIE